MYSAQTPLVQMAQLSHALKTEGITTPLRDALIRLGANDRVIDLVQQSPTALQQLFDGSPPIDRWNVL